MTTVSMGGVTTSLSGVSFGPRLPQVTLLSVTGGVVLVVTLVPTQWAPSGGFRLHPNLSVAEICGRFEGALRGDLTLCVTTFPLGPCGLSDVGPFLYKSVSSFAF